LRWRIAFFVVTEIDAKYNCVGISWKKRSKSFMESWKILQLLLEKLERETTKILMNTVDTRNLK
jgi:hypothetical protein